MPAPSESFMRLTRNPDLARRPPTKWEPTEKKPGEFILGRDGLISVQP
jgi:hypothetical protein